jgi:hypothetical protein
VIVGRLTDATATAEPAEVLEQPLEPKAALDLAFR